MTLPWKTKDPFLTMSMFVVAAAIIKFLADGVSFTAFGHPISLGHLDSLTYAAFLTPVLGAHSYHAVNKQGDAPDDAKN